MSRLSLSPPLSELGQEGECPVLIADCPGLEVVGQLLLNVADKIARLPHGPGDSPTVYADRRASIVRDLLKLSKVANAPVHPVRRQRRVMHAMRLALAGEVELIDYVEHLPAEQQDRLDRYRARNGFNVTLRAVRAMVGYAS